MPGIPAVCSLWIENSEAFIKRNARMMWRKTLNLREKLPEYVERSCHEAQINYRQRNRLSGSFFFAEFASADAKNCNHFLSRHVRERKRLSGDK